MKFRIFNPEVKVKQIDNYNSLVRQVKDFTIRADTFAEVIEKLYLKYDGQYGCKLQDCTIYTVALETNFGLRWAGFPWAERLAKRAKQADQCLENIKKNPSLPMLPMTF